jgi:hypothetical protein
MWTVQLVLLVFGLILIASAIVGGGLEIREIRVPKMSLIPRLLAGVVGGGCLVAALYSNFQPSETSGAGASSRNSDQNEVANEGEAPAIITDRLGRRQNYARLAVDIDGRRVGELVMTPQSRSGRLEIEPTPRVARYLLEGEESTQFGSETIQRRLAGEGTIEITPGAHFCVHSPESRGGSDRNISYLKLVPMEMC